jgi:hypothetical protein
MASGNISGVQLTTKCSAGRGRHIMMKQGFSIANPQEIHERPWMRSADFHGPLRELDTSEKQSVGRWLNNRIKNPHLPFQ